PVPDDERAILRRLLAGERVAVVGLSDDPGRPSHGVAMYLKSIGKTVLPVNPNHAQIMGVRCYASLADVPGPIDVVDVFRRPEHCARVVRDAIDVGAKGVWLQSGIISPEARRLAVMAKLDYVEDRCMMVEHMRAER
ncbi:MAG TPA: CoA-binding protein, partial [Tepidisphaeraceae bacterium]|nr:CoA-binding protein [Tepidisphaeraceae bacterium]